MDLKTSITELNNNFILKTNIPEWFVPAFRTLLSRNVTISSWNDLIKHLQNIVSDTKSLQDFVNRFSENLDDGDLSKLLKGISEVSDSSNFKTIHLEYVNGSSDTIKVPSDRFVQVVDDFIKLSAGDSVENIITKDYFEEYSGTSIAVDWEPLENGKNPFKLKISLKNSSGYTLSYKVVDFPLEQTIVSGSYENETKSLILYFQDGTTTNIPIDDLIEGLASKLDLDMKANIGVKQSHIAIDNIVTVPNDSAPYATVSKIGGMTRKCDNLLSIPNSGTETQKGLTLTYNGDGTFTINGTATAEAVFFYRTNVKLSKGDYFLKTNGRGMGWNSYWSGYSNEQTGKHDWDVGSGIKITSENNTFTLFVQIPSGKTLNNVVFKPMINEGTTALPYEPYFKGLRDTKVTAVKSVGANLLNLNTLIVTSNNTYTINTETGRVTVKFKAVYHPLRWKVKVPKNSTITLGIDDYSGAGATLQISDTLQIQSGNTETIDGKIRLGTGQKSVSINTGNYEELTFSVYVSESSNFNLDVFGIRLNKGSSLLPFTPYTEHTLTIPEALISKEWYGIGIPNTNAYNTADLENGNGDIKAGIVDLGNLSWTDYGTNSFAAYNFASNVALTDGEKPSDILAAEYENVAYSDRASGSKTICGAKASGVNTIFVRDTKYTNAADFKASMLGVKLIYKLATPETIDISNLITDDNLIGVEGGGTLTFVNEYGYSVPNEVVFYSNNNTIIPANVFVGD